MDVRSEKIGNNYYEVSVKILEGSNQLGKKLASQICVQVGNEKRYSRVIRQDKPFFDEYFVFTQFTNLAEFIDTLITISALEKKTGLKVRKLIGRILLDVGTIWSQPGRQLKKWFALSLPSDRSYKTNAFIECDFKISVATENYELPLSNIESSKILGVKRARYKVLIYRCTGLQVEATQKVLIRINYAGNTGKTKRKKVESSVDWNEQVVFLEIFPPMRQRLTIELCAGKNVLAVKNFSLHNFFKIFQGGVLEMFGPSCIHFYSEEKLYHGSLWIKIESEIVRMLREYEKPHGVITSTIEPIPEIKYGITKKFVCFGICFDIVITKPNCGKNDIQFSLQIGNSKSSQSLSYSAMSCDQYIYVPFNDEKPCISVTCEWPDCTFRLYNSNLLASLANDLREKLDHSYVLMSRGCDIEARNMLFSAFKKLESDSKRVLNLLSKGITELDAKRRIFLKDQLHLLVTLLASDDNLDNLVEKCEFFLNILESCCEDVQDSLPSLLISIRQGDSSVGSCTVYPRDLIFSKLKEKCGRYSAKIHNFTLKRKDGRIVGRVTFWLWLGKSDQINKCMKQFPPGYQHFPPDQLPSILTYPHGHKYNMICHIHCGYIDKEAVSEGQCDSYVKVYFLNQSRRTTTIKRTLAPFWKETLTLPDITLFSSPNYIKENPPSIVIQLWNEAIAKPKLIGSRLIPSTVRLQPFSNNSETTLKWWNIERCQVFAACELVEISEGNDSPELLSIRRQNIFPPRMHEPPTINYRLEVVFWGMRPSYVRALKNVVQPQVIVQFSTVELSSDVISRASTTFNFQHDTRIVSLKLPENRIYSPPLIIKIMSNVKYLTSVAEKNIYRYEYQLPNTSQWEALNVRRIPDRVLSVASSSQHVSMPDCIPKTEVVSVKSSTVIDPFSTFPNTIRNLLRDSFFIRLFHTHETSSNDESSFDEIEQDWWDRYEKGQIQIYPDTLENQKAFSGFTDILSTFSIKQTHQSPEICRLKAIIMLYKWPIEEPVVTMQGQDPSMGVLKPSELNSSVKILVRVYCVKATDLYPSDLNGKSDPYIEIATPTKRVSDKINKILCELNPVFGNFLEITATLPIDPLLAVRVMDWDAFSRDDLIGETIIDIENRFYSKHRATCGLPEAYSKVGPNAWRDIETPTEILERICNTHNLPLPQYHEKKVFIGSKEFGIHRASSDKEENQERLALEALNNWEDMPIVGRPLVGEHVETRLLFREDLPGLVQGKLYMWVDLFDMSLGTVPLPINIAPRLPQAYELRVNILNTEHIPLVDQSTIAGKSCTDIVVTGWLGDEENVQKTDVHYQSYTGTGNFNWRFVFPFLYFRKEKKMVFYKKNLFDIGKKEVKVPAVINLEVHDNEGLLEDSFIGGMMLELCRMPKGAQSVKTCIPKKLLDPSNYVDLFHVESLRGWWPFLMDKTLMEVRGFLEAEFFLVTAEEAHKSPVGLGRSPPDPMPVPSRASGRVSPWRLFLDFIAKHDCQAYNGYALSIILILFILVVLVLILILALLSVFGLLQPILKEIF